MGRGLWSSYLDGDWSRALWSIFVVVLIAAIAPILATLGGGVLRRGSSGIGPLLGHGILACALVWATIRVSASFADYFYPGRPATSIAPIAFAAFDEPTSTGQAPQPDGQAMANYAAAVFQQIQARASDIRSLERDIADKQFAAWVGQDGLLKVIKFTAAAGKSSGLIALKTTAPPEQIKVEVQGTDFSPLIAWALGFLRRQDTLRVQLTALGEDSWQATYNVDASGLETASFNVRNAPRPRDAASGFAWEYARRSAKEYARLPALQRMTLPEYKLLLEVYAEFSNVIHEAYQGRISGGSSIFVPDTHRFSELLDQAIGPHFAKPTGGSDPVPPGAPSADPKPSLFPRSANWSELSRFIGTVAQLADRQDIGQFFFDQAAGLELERKTPVPEEAQIPPDYLTKINEQSEDTLYGLITDRPALFTGFPSVERGTFLEYSGVNSKVLVAATADNVRSAQSRLGQLLSQSQAKTIILDIPPKLAAQPAVKYQITSAKKNDRRRIITRDELTPGWSSVEEFVKAIQNVTVGR